VVTWQGQEPADMLGRLGRHWGWVLAYGILTLLAGILVLAFPGLTLLGLAVILGIWLLVFGIMEMTAAFRLRKLASG
jgi:uncharacterized membrane protein HdeD (DUF308 family)